MDDEIDQKRAGLALGILSAALQALWVAAVGLGLAQGLIGLWRSAHFVEIAYTVTPFSITAALTGIVAAFAAGYIIGWLFAALWNRLKS